MFLYSINEVEVINTVNACKKTSTHSNDIDMVIIKNVIQIGHLTNHFSLEYFLLA